MTLLEWKTRCDRDDFLEFDLFGRDFNHSERGRRLVERLILRQAEERLQMFTLPFFKHEEEVITFTINGPSARHDWTRASPRYQLSEEVATRVVEALRHFHALSAKWDCLHFSNVGVNEGLLEILEAAREYQLFQRVQFSMCDSIDVVLRDYGKHKNSWKSLHLSGMTMGIEEMTALGNILKAQSSDGSYKLEELELSQVTYGLEAGAVLADGLAANRTLTSLTLTSWAFDILPGGIWVPIQSHRTLKSLSLRSCMFSEDATRSLVRTLSEPSSQLETLNIVNCCDVHLNILCDGIRDHQSLTSLSLNSCGLEYVHLPRLLSVIQTCSRLVELDLSNNLRHGRSVNMWCDGLIGHQSLSRLSLQSTSLSAATVRDIVSILHTCPNLKEVDLSDNEDLDELNFTGLSLEVPPAHQIYQLKLGKFYRVDRRHRETVVESITELLRIFPALSMTYDLDFVQFMPPFVHIRLALNYAGRGCLRLGAKTTPPPSHWLLILDRIDTAISGLNEARSDVGLIQRAARASALFVLISEAPAVIVSCRRDSW